MSRTVRTLTLAEIQTLLDWAAAEGWNPGLDDAVPFRAADPGGFLGAFVGAELVAGISAVAYDEHYGFIGLYICHPDWRGQGHGKAVWDAAMAYLGDRTIGLDGVAEQQANYAKMGFVPAYETIRMSGTLWAQAYQEEVQKSATLEAIRNLDRSCFPAPRDAFLEQWIALPRRSWVHAGSEAILGYAVSRRCQEGTKLGPLFALTMDTAVEILASQSGLIHIDVPAQQSTWLSSNNNSEVNALAVSIAIMAIAFIYAAAFILAVMAVWSMFLTVFCIRAWRKPVKLGKHTIYPWEARAFVISGFCGTLIFPAIVGSIAQSNNIYIDPDYQWMKPDKYTHLDRVSGHKQHFP